MEEVGIPTVIEDGDLLWVGLDESGRELEVIAVPIGDDVILVKHVMPTAPKEEPEMVTKHIDPTNYRVTAATRDGGSIDLDTDAVSAPDGHRVTEAETEAFTTNRGGRPSLSGERKHSPVIGVRVSPQVRDQIDAAAKAAGVPTSEIVRQALGAWLQSHRHQRRATSKRH